MVLVHIASNFFSTLFIFFQNSHFKEYYFTLDSHTNTDTSNFSRIWLLVEMASKTVPRSIEGRKRKTLRFKH